MSQRRGPGRHDAGHTMVEILVVLGITSVVGAIFTASLLQIYRTVSAIEAGSFTQSQLSLALLRVDNTSRYAYEIGAPHTEGTTPYVEYLVVAPEPGGSEYVQRCVQLRLFGSDAQNLQLQTRSWTVATTVSPSAWTPLASGLSTVSGAAPFVRTQPTTALNHQLLGIKLVARSGTSNKATRAVTYTALNSNANTALDASGNPIAVTAEPCYHTATRS